MSKEGEGEVYQKVVKRKLSFKGDNAKLSVKSTHSVLGKRKNDTPESRTERKPSTVEDVQILNGTGRISSSATTIHGHGTEFMAQLNVNDAIIVSHPTSLQEETKIVRMVLSNVSIGISSAFSSDLISTVPFRFIKAPKEEENLEEKARVEKEKSDKAEEAAFGTYASRGGSQFTYRVKKDGAYGGYKIVTETTQAGLSREELLDQRMKKKSDRHCY